MDKLDSPWEFWEPNPYAGLSEVEFTTGEIRTIHIKRGIVTTYGRLLHLEDMEGRLYNSQVIISIKKKE